MKLFFAACAALLPALASATPVHITLRPSAMVQPDAADFFSLGSVADLSGGTPAERAKLAAVSIGRAPLPDETREITLGDVSLKLRQAGFHPGQDAILGGAPQADLTTGAPTAVSAAAPRMSGAVPVSPTISSAPPPILIRAGAPVTIRIDDGALNVTTIGVAETSGAAGDLIRVHRSGVSGDLVVTVVDSQTVELEP